MITYKYKYIIENIERNMNVWIEYAHYGTRLKIGIKINYYTVLCLTCNIGKSSVCY